MFAYSVHNILDLKSIQEEVAKEKRRVILTLTEFLAQLNQSLKLLWLHNEFLVLRVKKVSEPRYWFNDSFAQAFLLQKLLLW